MSRALASYPEHQRPKVVARRLAGGAANNAIRGNGYWAAQDYMNKTKRKIEVPEKPAESEVNDDSGAA